MLFHGFECLLGFIVISLEEEKNSLFIVEFLIVLSFVFSNVLVKLLKFFLFVFIVVNLSMEKKSRSFLRVFSFDLFVSIDTRFTCGKEAICFGIQLNRFIVVERIFHISSE